MFTLLPSLYLITQDFVRRWKNDQIVQSEIFLDQPRISTNERKTKIRKKKSHHGFRMERRRTFTHNLLDDDLNYLMQRSDFTREQILLWHQEFLCDCPDGKLSKEQFTEIYQQVYKKGRVTKFCECAFRVFDKDRSGFIDFVEFLLAINLTSSKNSEQKLDLFFAMCDIDGNGRIDEEEMHCFIEAIYELMGIDTRDPSRIDSKVYELFSTAQCDSLGCLKKEQFALACQTDRHIRKLLMATNKIASNV